jgi:hypothetical protein
MKLIDNKAYKNNIQTNLLGVIGYTSLHYERALNKNFSLSLISNYINPMFTSSSKKISSHVEGRFYTDKNSTLNNGFYLAGDIGFNYERYYHSATYSYYNFTTHNVSEYNEDIKYLWAGLGLGYQLLAKKRFVIDVNIITFLGFKGKYKLSNETLGWRSLPQFSQGGTLYSINIGYAF